MTDKIAIQEAIDALGLTVDVVFVPWSQSRNKGKDSPSLNWKVTLLRNGRQILTTDYSAGCGHTAAYNASKQSLGSANCIDRHDAIKRECESGIRYGTFQTKPQNPDSVDVIASLALDSSVIDCGSFEEWADEFGYDTDSRKAETIYRECLAHALALRAAIGDAGLSALREAFQDY